jgi:hypothetical protein
MFSKFKKLNVKLQIDFYYQFQVSIIAKNIFLLKLYLFKVQKFNEHFIHFVQNLSFY